MNANDILNSITIEAKNNALNILKSYSKVYIIFRNSKYYVSPNISISNIYYADEQFIGIVLQDEVYTEEERKYNYSQL